MKKFYLFFLFLVIGVLAYSIDLNYIDNLHNNSNYKEAYKILISSFDKASPNSSIIWRIGREYYDFANDIRNKKDKITKLEEGLDFLQPFCDLKNGEIRDRASIIYWYAVLSSERARTKGIKESLDNIPNLFKYCESAISVDQSYGDPYYLMAMINDGLPTIFGGDKFKMSENISKALKLDPQNYWYLIDGAAAYKNRGWDLNKKKKMAIKKGKTDESPQDIGDKEYALLLLKKALEIYNNDTNKTKIVQIKIDEAKKLLKKLD